MDIVEAQRMVKAAVTHGFVYDDETSLSSPRADFERTFREFDEQVAGRNELHASWLLTGRYRVSPSFNEISGPAVQVAEHDLPAFIEALETVTDSERLYEIAFFPLEHSDIDRRCTWIEVAKDPRVVALAIAFVLRGLLPSSMSPEPPWQRSIDRSTSALRTRNEPERSRLWWQIAALARFVAPLHVSTELSRALWIRASEEAEVGPAQLHAYFEQSEILLRQCPAIRALLARIGARGDGASHKEAAHLVLRDFGRRLDADRAELPRFDDPIELEEYVTACGWAVAQDAANAELASWWEEALAARLPRFPTWRRVRGNDERCAQILVAACYAAERLARSDTRAAGRFAAELFKQVEEWLPRWLWGHAPTHSAMSILPVVCVSTALSVDPENQERVWLFAREVRDCPTLTRMVEALERLGTVPDATLARLRALRDDRSDYEKRLNQSRS